MCSTHSPGPGQRLCNGQPCINGVCQPGGTCACDMEYMGADCSIHVSLVADFDQPRVVPLLSPTSQPLPINSPPSSYPPQPKKKPFSSFLPRTPLKQPLILPPPLPPSKLPPSNSPWHMPPKQPVFSPPRPLPPLQPMPIPPSPPKQRLLSSPRLIGPIYSPPPSTPPNQPPSSPLALPPKQVFGPPTKPISSSVTLDQSPSISPPEILLSSAPPLDLGNVTANGGNETNATVLSPPMGNVETKESSLNLLQRKVVMKASSSSPCSIIVRDPNSPARDALVRLGAVAQEILMTPNAVTTSSAGPCSE